MLPELFIAFHISPDSREVALLEDITWGREPYGEYVFYLASDKDARFAEDPSMIDFNKSKLSFQVHVSFEEPIKNIANSMINQVAAADGDSYELVEEIIGDRSSDDVLGVFNSDGFILPVTSYSSDTQAAWLDIGLNALGRATMQFKFVSVEQDRTIEIIGSSNSESVVGDIYNKWIELVEEYKSIPYYRFTGATIE